MAICLKYEMNNLQPLRIADNSTSQNGQTQCLHYIPGTTVRGIIIHSLVGEADFEIRYKKILLSDRTCFLNGYPIIKGRSYRADGSYVPGERDLIPSPMGFNESRNNAGILKSSLSDQRPSCEYKRADLGGFSYIEGDTIIGARVETGEKMGITIGKGKEKAVFRETYVCLGQDFTGYIITSDEELADRIIRKMKDTIILAGSTKSSGYGKCRFRISRTTQSPYETYLKKGSAERELYMLVMSDTAMRNRNGEIIGLDLEMLENKLGVTHLQIAHCSSSIHKNSGINHTWGLRTPEIPMYRAGSVFHFTFEGTVQETIMRELEMEGIGIRKNEGCGRILFVDFIPGIQKKLISGKHKIIEERADNGDLSGFSQDDMETLKIVARRHYRNIMERATDRYIVENPLPTYGLANSQLGNIQALCTVLKHQPEIAEKKIKEYLDRTLEKEDKNKRHGKKASKHQFFELIRDIFKKELDEVLGLTTEHNKIMGIEKKELLSDREQISGKLELIEGMIRYYGRGQKAE